MLIKNIKVSVLVVNFNKKKNIKKRLELLANLTFKNIDYYITLYIVSLLSFYESRKNIEL